MLNLEFYTCHLKDKMNILKSSPATPFLKVPIKG